MENNNQVSESESESNFKLSILNKLKEDLFDYRVDIKSYKRSLNIIIISVTVLGSILAFFGYSKIEHIENTIMAKANNRLKITDSILAKIDGKRIDSLNNVIVIKEKEYQTTIENFEKLILYSKELELKLLESIKENERITVKNNSYFSEFPTDMFYIHPINKNVEKLKSYPIYLVINNINTFSKEDYLSINVFPKGRRVLILDKTYKVNSKFNKLSFGIEPFENNKIYELEISFFKREKNGYRKHSIVEEITIK